MPSAPKIVTFDCYGTLIDWESGIVEACQTEARRAGVTLGAQTIVEAHARIEPAVQREQYLPYRAVLTETGRRMAEMLGWPLPAERTGFLAESLASWRPFPDTNPSLERLADAGIRLGILSNIDDDLLAMTRRHLTVDFALVITAERMRSYKPAHAHFLAAREVIASDEWLHAAQSNFHDIVPCNELGIRSAWVNRHQSKPLPGGVPSFEVRHLAELAAALTQR